MVANQGAMRSGPCSAGVHPMSEVNASAKSIPELNLIRSYACPCRHRKFAGASLSDDDVASSSGSL